MKLENIPILSILIFLPLVGAFFISLIDRSVSIANTRKVALWTSVVTFGLALILLLGIDIHTPSYQFINHATIFEGINLEYKVGINGGSLAFILFTTFLFSLSIWAGWDRIQTQLKLYMILLLIFETLVLGAFAQLNLLMFFVFFEATVIPLYFLMGIWGGKDKAQASLKFLGYSLISSFCLLLVLMKILEITNTLDFERVSQFPFPPSSETWLFLGLFLSLSIKVPLIPFHVWFPQAQTQFPTPVSMIAGSAFVQLGTYSIIKILIPLFPYAAMRMGPFICSLGAVGIVYMAWVAFGQKNIKKLIAYASLSQVCLVILGIFSFHPMALMGAVFYLLSYGVVGAALFFSVEVLYRQMQTYSIEDYGGISKVMPDFSLIFFLVLLANMGFPGTGGFIGQIFILIGLHQIHPLLLILTGVSIFFSGIYTLWLYQRVAFGVITSTLVRGLVDLNLREKSILVTCLGLIFLMGFFPDPFLRLTEKSLISVLNSQKQPSETLELAEDSHAY